VLLGVRAEGGVQEGEATSCGRPAQDDRQRYGAALKKRIWA